MECMWPEWSQWSEWSNNCDNDVGEGLRRRSCSVEMPNPGCPGETTETRECIEKGSFLSDKVLIFKLNFDDNN